MKKIIIFLAFIITASVFNLTLVLAEDIKVEDLTKNVKISSSKSEPFKNIFDGDYSTKEKIVSETEYKITSEKEIASVYIIWDTVAAKTIIESGGLFSKAGEKKIIHELVKLEKSSKEIIITAPKNSVICDIYFFTKGNVFPDFVQEWKPSHNRADILLMSTHGEDQSVYMGGIVPYYAGELGLAVQVAYFVNHNLDPIRNHEILNGLWAVGLKNYPIIPGFPDLDAPNLGAAEEFYKNYSLLDYQVYLLRRLKPSVVIAHDKEGENGDAIHMLNTKLLIEALEMSGVRSQFENSSELYDVWDVPKTYLHLFPSNQYVMDMKTKLTKFSDKTIFEVAKEGFSHQISQQNLFSFQLGGKTDMAKFGLFRDRTGKENKTFEFMENIEPIKQEEVKPVELKNPIEQEEQPTKVPEKTNPIIYIVVIVLSILIVGFFILREIF
jgi:LmbE family N-acetylglucosaminyl deacetylase